MNEPPPTMLSSSGKTASSSHSHPSSSTTKPTTTNNLFVFIPTFLHHFFEFIRPSNAMNIFLSALGGFLCFSIVMFTNIPSTLDDNTQLLDSIRNGQDNQASMIVNLTLLFLLYVDQLLDGCQNLLLKMKSPKKKKEYANTKAWKTVLNLPERMIFMFGMAVVPIVSLLSPSTPKLALIWHCSSRAQVVFVGGIIFASKCRHDVHFSHPLVQWALYFFFIFGNAISPFSANDLANETYDTMQAVGCYCGAGICLVTMFRCFVQLSYKIYTLYLPNIDHTEQKYTIKRKNSNDNDDENDDHGDIENGGDGGDIRNTENTAKPITTSVSKEDHVNRNFLVYQLIYVGCIIIWIFLKLWVDLTTPDAIHLNDYQLFLLNIPDIIFLFMLMIFTMRLVKYEVIETMEALDAEKEYIRCISHEIRIPQSYEGDDSQDENLSRINPQRSMKSALSVSFHEHSIRYEYTDDDEHGQDIAGGGEGKTNESKEKRRPLRSVGSSRNGRNHSSSRHHHGHTTNRSEISSMTSPTSVKAYDHINNTDDDLKQDQFLRMLKATSKDVSRNVGMYSSYKFGMSADVAVDDEREDDDQVQEIQDNEKIIIAVDETNVQKEKSTLNRLTNLNSEPILTIVDYSSENTSQSDGRIENKIVYDENVDVSPVVNTVEQSSIEVEQRPSEEEEWEKEKNKVMGSFMRMMMARNNI